MHVAQLCEARAGQAVSYTGHTNPSLVCSALTGVRRYQLPPESSKPAQPSLEAPQQQWQSMLSQQGPDVPLADCMLRAYQVHVPSSQTKACCRITGMWWICSMWKIA